MAWVNYRHSNMATCFGPAEFEFWYLPPQSKQRECRKLKLMLAKGFDPYDAVDRALRRFTLHIRTTWVGGCMRTYRDGVIFTVVHGPVEEIATARAAAELAR